MKKIQMLIMCMLAVFLAAYVVNGLADTVKIVTVKPQEKTVEYAIYDTNNALVVHGHTFTYTNEASMTEWQLLAETNAVNRGYLITPSPP